MVKFSNFELLQKLEQNKNIFQFSNFHWTHVQFHFPLYATDVKHPQSHVFFFSIFILRIFLGTLPISLSMKVQTLFIFCFRPRAI